MTNYGKDAILSAATTLPATSGIGLLLLNHTHPTIVAALLVISSANLLVLLTTISRFLINSTRNK